MEIEKVYNWLSAKYFQVENGGKNPLQVTITAYKQGKGNKGLEHLLLVNYDGKLFQFSIYGDSLNYLIDTFGSQTDAWVGKIIQVMMVKKGEKDERRIAAVK